MDNEELEACRDLIDFARDYSEQVYGSDKPEENAGSKEATEHILAQAKTLEHYLDN